MYNHAYNALSQVSFDPKKDAKNKHGISLAEADGVLNDPLALTVEDKAAEGERRFVSIGLDLLQRLTVVVYADYGDKIRLIAARAATPRERRAYEKGI